jgi:CRP-like cAMP-binding protein
MIAFTLPTAVLVWVDAAAVGIGIQVVRGAATLALDVLAVTALQRSLPPEMIARVFGIFGALSLGAVALGALVMPVSLNLLGLDGTLLLVSVGASGLVVLAYPFTRRVDRELADRLAALEPRIAALSGLGIFSSASRTMLERLAGAAEEVSMPAGTRIITQGEPADAFYVLTSGTVSVSKTVEDGTQQPLQTLGAGEFFGEIGLLEAGERTANVDADTEVELLRLPGEEFIAALTEAPPTTAFLEHLRRHRHRRRPGRRERGRLRPPARPVGRHRRVRPGRRRVQLLGLHALQGAAASDRGARGGEADPRRRGRGHRGDRRRRRAAQPRRLHLLLGRRRAGELARLGRGRPPARPRPAHR